MFSGLSNRIQNDLIEAVGEVIRNDIQNEINAASFVAVEVDETTDVTNKAQISVILRYVAKSEVACEVREAFCSGGGKNRFCSVSRYFAHAIISIQ